MGEGRGTATRGTRFLFSSDNVSLLKPKEMRRKRRRRVFSRSHDLNSITQSPTIVGCLRRLGVVTKGYR